MSLCENCKSLDTCAVAMPNMEKCFFFAPTEDFKIKNSKEYAIGYEQGIDDFLKEVENWIAYSYSTLSYSVLSKIAEKLK